MKTIQRFLWVVLLAMPVMLFAQSSGKIVGIVKDQASGEPLPGVNVFITGTTLGAATDVDGYYVILNVPVGVYDIQASFVGYQDVVLSGIRITADKTSEANFDLGEAAIEGQAVVITAEKPLVEKYTTQSVSLVTSEDLENIPIRGFNNVIATQNSVVQQDGNIHIRGSRPDEVGYYIDGASSLDAFNNQQALYVIQEAVEEFQVLAGGYTAEFGGANAGIIRTELRTGSKKFKVSMDFQTDKFAGEGEKFLGTYSYRQHTGVATISGPLLSDKVRFFFAGENSFKGDRSTRFSEGFTLNNLIDANQDNSNVINGNPDTINAYNYPSGFTPQREEDQWAFQGTLLLDLSPIQLRLSGSYSDRSRQRNSFRTPDIGARPDTPMLNVLNNRTFDDVFTNTLMSAKLTYILDSKTILDGSLNYFNSIADREDSYFGNDWQQWFDSTAVANHTNNEVTYRSRWAPEYDYLFNGWYFARNGDPYRRYIRNDQQYLGGSLNFTTQASRHHELKIGGDIRRYTLRRFLINANVMNLLETNNASDIRDVSVSQWASTGQVINYGYDVYGNKADDDQFAANGNQIADAPKHPVFASMYLQDKIEFNDLIINAGLRFDYYDTKGQRFNDLENPIWDANSSTFTDENWVDVEPFQQVSPRLGFSFPINEKTVFYMQYGKFIQMPSLLNNYSSSQRYGYEYISAGFSFQNPSGFGLDPVRTTSYEIGFRQQLSSVAAFDISGFYRNVKGQVQVDKIFPDPSSGLQPFNILVNGDFATTKGLEFGLTLRRVQRLQTQLNYTLTQAEGSGSTNNTAVAALEQQTARPTVINPLDFEQKHRGSVILDYRFNQNEGGAVFQNFGANMLFTFNSGHPFTYSLSEVGQSNAYDAGTDYMLDPRARRALEGVNTSITPFNYQFDLRLDKSFQVLKDLQATVYMRVNNLFNTKNVINVYNATGNAEDDGFVNNLNEDQRDSYLQAYGEEWLKQYQLINIQNGQAYWDKLGLELYGNPRQIFFGLKLNY